MKYWLVKSEPYKYSWEQLLKDGSTFWDGVRNYTARNYLKEMKIGDKVFFYHSNEGKEIVGLSEVIKEHYPDPTIDDERWVAVDIKPLKTFNKPLSLKTIKEHELLKNMTFIRIPRLSVSDVKKDEYDVILSLCT